MKSFYFIPAKINSAKSPQDIKSAKINSAKYALFYPSSAKINSALINSLKVVKVCSEKSEPFFGQSEPYDSYKEFL